MDEARNITMLIVSKDLAWHTHQLNAKMYRENTTELLGRTPNHEDSVAQGTLSTAYDITAKTWRVSASTAPRIL